jgi:hypothetical protein
MWQRIQTRTPPPTTGNPERLLELWDRLNPDRDGVADLDQTDAYEQLLAYEDARLREKAAKAEKEQAKARLVELLGGNAMGAFGNQYAYGLNPTSKATPDLERLAEEFPDAYAACVEDKPGHRLHIAKEHRLTEPLS